MKRVCEALDSQAEPVILVGHSMGGIVISQVAEEHADLFWAIRGGGGNFGVVTSFLFKLHPISTVYGGPMLWPFEQAADVMKFWRDFILQAPEEINGWFVFFIVPPVPLFPEQFHLQKMCAIVWCYSGEQDKADEYFQSFRAHIPPTMDFAGPISWPALQSLFDALSPLGLQWYWKSDFFTELSDKAIELHLKYSEQLPTMQSTMHLYPINGAVHRVGPSETAFSYREANFAEVILGIDPDPANNERMIGWARDYWMALHPYSAGGGYINMMMDESADSVQEAYRDNYRRLAQIKAKYDLTNLFHVNQNIKPSRLNGSQCRAAERNRRIHTCTYTAEGRSPSHSRCDRSTFPGSTRQTRHAGTGSSATGKAPRLRERTQSCAPEAR